MLTLSIKELHIGTLVCSGLWGVKISLLEKASQALVLAPAISLLASILELVSFRAIIFDVLTVRYFPGLSLILESSF